MSLPETLFARFANIVYQNLFLAALSLLVLYLIANTTYQLYFSPLSKFPGPKLAAVTLWYEIYYDVFKWGKYYLEVRKMHERYGPMVRISPFELHVSDPDFIEILYSRSAPRDKHAYMTRAFGLNEASFSTVSHTHHRLRRAAIAPFFSKQRVLGLQDLIRRHVSKLCTQFNEYKASGQPLPTLEAFSCLTADIIIEYSMGVQQKCLHDPDFAPLYTQAVKKSAMLGVYAKHLPWLYSLATALQHWLGKLNPEYGAIFKFRNLNIKRVTEVFERKDREKAGLVVDEGYRKTIFDDLYDKLLGAIPDSPDQGPPSVPDLPALEALPYLSAVIHEGLRISHGLSCRNARLAHEPLRYKDWVIPAFTPVGMDAPSTHLDESIFPNSNSFMPERWLSPDGHFEGKTPDGRSLERFLMSFGRGARQCVGINLAKAELNIALSSIVRRFEFELFECDRRDVDMVHDLTLPG
ncbi:hypothetical protein E8E11_004200 [Didymella keratinophila]|nr:hypothetical protein E8E11_004200 [Didymella keratinophila]